MQDYTAMIYSYDRINCRIQNGIYNAVSTRPELSESI